MDFHIQMLLILPLWAPQRRCVTSHRKEKAEEGRRGGGGGEAGGGDVRYTSPKLKYKSNPVLPEVLQTRCTLGGKEFERHGRRRRETRGFSSAAAGGASLAGR